MTPHGHLLVALAKPWLMKGCCCCFAERYSPLSLSLSLYRINLVWNLAQAQPS